MRRLLAGASVFLLSACGGEGNDDEPAQKRLGPPPIHPVPGCEAIDHRACDVFVPECRERLMTLAACLRGSPPLAVPPVTFMTTAEYADLVNARIADDPPPDPNHYERALTLLDLVVPGELSGALVDPADVTVAGVYRNTEKDILIIDHGDEEDEKQSNYVLVHEFVHALQDHDVDLMARYDEFATSYDSYLAYAAVVEGEARMHETRFIASLFGLDPAELDWSERFQNAVELGESAIADEASPYSATWSYFPYSHGARFVHHAWEESGPAAISALFQSPPRHAHAVMDSLLGVAVDAWPESAFVVPSEAPAPWTLWAEETLGAWGVFLVLTRQETLGNVRPVAREWRGDRLWIFSDDGAPAQTTMVWQLEFSDVYPATRFETIARRIAPHVVRDHARVTLASTTGTSAIDWALVP